MIKRTGHPQGQDKWETNKGVASYNQKKARMGEQKAEGSSPNKKL